MGAEHETVLIAEDDAIIRMDLREMLAEEGYVVAEAADGTTALALAREAMPALCIFDVKMPEMDGITAARHITDERIAPVVILTAYSQRELVERATDAGAMAYLVKPFQKKDLLPAIEVAKARYRQLAALADEVGDLNERLEARKVIDRARGIIMDRYGLSEADAFHFIQRAAMERRVTMREVAASLIEGPLPPGAAGPQ